MSDFHHPQPLTNEQIALLEAVKPRILAEAETFDMGVVFHCDYSNGDCGTPACIAGHLIAMTERAFTLDYPMDDLITAANMLGVDRSRHDTPLFYLEDWEDDLAQDYGDAFPISDRATVAIRAIDRYIENTRAHFANV